MSEASPSAASPCTSPESDTGYRTLPRDRVLDGRTLTLVPVQERHVEILWRQLGDEDNAKLFLEAYGVSCSSKLDLWTIMQNHADTFPESAAWTIIDKHSRKAAGWAVLQPSPEDSSSIDCALFLPRLSRSEVGSEAIHCLSCLIFNDLEFEKLEFRAGKLNESSGPQGGPLGITLIGVLSRQLRDDARSINSDLYVLPRQKWPHVYAAVKAWMDAKAICTGTATGAPVPLNNIGIR